MHSARRRRRPPPSARFLRRRTKRMKNSRSCLCSSNLQRHANVQNEPFLSTTSIKLFQKGVTTHLMRNLRSHRML